VQAVKLVSAVGEQAIFLVPGGLVSEVLQAVQPPLMTRATACVDQVPFAQALQVVFAVVVQVDLWPAAHVDAPQGLQEFAFVAVEKLAPNVHEGQEASALTVQSTLYVPAWHVRSVQGLQEPAFTVVE